MLIRYIDNAALGASGQLLEWDAVVQSGSATVASGIGWPGSPGGGLAFTLGGTGGAASCSVNLSPVRSRLCVGGYLYIPSGWSGIAGPFTLVMCYRSFPYDGNLSMLLALYFYPDGTVRPRLTNFSDPVEGPAMPLNRWFHLACLYDWIAGQRHIWVDGVQVVNAPLSMPGYTANQTTIGPNYIDDATFVGSLRIDEIRLGTELSDVFVPQASAGLELSPSLRPDQLSPVRGAAYIKRTYSQNGW